WDGFLMVRRVGLPHIKRGMFGLSPRTARSVARALLLVLGLGGAVLTSHAVLGQAHGQSKAQQHLQKILARQRYWQGRLKAERKQELALETRLTTTNLHL